MPRSQSLPASSSDRRRPRRRFPLPWQKAARCCALLVLLLAAAAPPPEVRVLFEGPDAGPLASAVTAVGGRVTHRMPRVAALGATVPVHRLAGLTADPALRRWWPERRVTAAGPPADAPIGSSARARLVRADRLHADGLTGRGVTIAVVDGDAPGWLAAAGPRRPLAVYDAMAGRPAAPPGGHAEGVLEAMLSSRPAADGGFAGIAPGADLVLVRVLGGDGSGRVADVVRGIDWVIANRDRYGIRVLNLSLTAPPPARYWDDPLNRAVMAAWSAGIVVVAAAGNGGPELGSVASPGDVPYVVTVGAAGGGAAADPVAPYSPAGPTHDGFVKPELLAPGALAGDAGAVGAGPRQVAGGTSIAAAVVSGIAALLLEAEPWLSPDQVKHRLLAGARPAAFADGTRAAPLLRQGAGLVDAWAAASGGSAAGANRGLDVVADLAGERHFRGGRPDSDFELRPEGLAEAYLWSYGTAGGPSPQALRGYTWSDRALTAPPGPESGLRGYTWSDRALTAPPGMESSLRGYTWSDRALTAPPGTENTLRGYTWSDRSKD